jgi:hypothetical protein
MDYSSRQRLKKTQTAAVAACVKQDRGCPSRN